MTVGLVLFALVILRLAYRAAHPPPPLPANVTGLERAFAQLTHWLLYALLVIMPVTGYIMSAGDKPPVVFLGLFEVPKARSARSKASQFAIYALIAIHLVGTGWHMFVRRDNILGRMMPRQTNAEAPEIAATRRRD